MCMCLYACTHAHTWVRGGSNAVTERLARALSSIATMDDMPTSYNSMWLVVALKNSPSYLRDRSVSRKILQSKFNIFYPCMRLGPDVADLMHPSIFCILMYMRMTH